MTSHLTSEPVFERHSTIDIPEVADYLTKVMPATTVLTTAGTYVNGLLPVPTAIYTSAYVETGKALLCIPTEYYALVAAQLGLELSDEYKFLEDKRVYKQVMYGCWTSQGQHERHPARHLCA